MSIEPYHKMSPNCSQGASCVILEQEMKKEIKVGDTFIYCGAFEKYKVVSDSSDINVLVFIVEIDKNSIIRLIKKKNTTTFIGFVLNSGRRIELSRSFLETPGCCFVRL